MKEYFNKDKVEEYYPGATMIPPMKINKFPGTRGKTMQDVYESGEYFSQIKKDGAFYMYNKTSTGESYLFGRTKSRQNGLLTEKSANVPHIIEVLDKIFENQSCLVIGEIYYPNKTSKDVTTIMGCLPKKAVERQKDNLIHYYIYDIIMYNDNDLTGWGALRRWDMLRGIVSDSKRNGIEIPNYIELAETYTKDLEQVTYNALSSGEEGVVLKKIDGKYYPDLRPAWETIKVKQYMTLDVVCTGFCEPTVKYEGKELENWEYWMNPDTKELYPVGKYYDNYIREEECMFYMPVTKPYYYDWKTAIKIGAYNRDKDIIDLGTVSSGLTDFLREDFSKNPNKYLYEVVEIGGMNLEDNAIRHGRLIRFRDDKTDDECLYEEIFK